MVSQVSQVSSSSSSWELVDDEDIVIRYRKPLMSSTSSVICQSVLQICMHVRLQQMFIEFVSNCEVFETAKSSEIAKSFETAKSFANYDF